MKEFFKMMFASMAGFVAATVFISIASIAFMFILIFAFSGESEEHISDKSILKIDLNFTISDRGGDAVIDANNPFNSNFDGTPSLSQIIGLIKRAEKDPKIKGIYLSVANVRAGSASLKEIRDRLIEFKASKKFIVAYSEDYSQRAYYLASVADTIFLNPNGMVDFKGINVQLVFLKGFLDKIGVQAEVVRHGKFKSAVEPYISDRMSEENREQTKLYVKGIWDDVINSVSADRKISPEKLNDIADSLIGLKASACIDYKLVDKLAFEDEVLAGMAKATGVENADKLHFVSLDKYLKGPLSPEEKEISKHSDKIAVIYASGEIHSGSSNQESIGSDTYVKEIKKATEDSDVKAIVLRVNSPGGSAQASDIIWRQILEAKKKKPVVVSMGDVAASGGYYISCGADYIVAEPNTITGSIGVFGLVLNMQDLFNNKLGLTFDGVMTNQNSDFGLAFKPLSPFKRAILQARIEDVYKDFITKVSQGRKLNVDSVDAIAQGRVWIGTDALKNKLIDTLGGLRVAVKKASKLANVTNYKLVSYPKNDDVLTKFIRKYMINSEESIMREKLGTLYPFYGFIKSILVPQSILTRMPFDVIFE